MPRIGDTIRPELQRADTSGILKGAAIGGQAMGQGIAALGAGIAGGIKQRKENEKVVTGTISRMEALQKAQAPDSPLAAMLGEGIAQLGNPDLSPRKAAAMAAGFNQSVDDTFKSIESNILQEEAARQEELHNIAKPLVELEAMMKAAGPDAILKAQSDNTEFAGNREGLTKRIGDRVRAMTDPAGWRQDQEKKQEEKAGLLREYEEAEAYGKGLEEELYTEHGYDRIPGMEMDIGAKDLLPDSKLDRIQEILTEPKPLVPIIPSEIQQAQPGEPTGRIKAAAYLQALQAQNRDIKSVTIPDTDEAGNPISKHVLSVDGVAQPHLEISRQPKGRMYPTAEEAGLRQQQELRIKGSEGRLSAAMEAGGLDNKEAIVTLQRGLAILRNPDIETDRFATFKTFALSVASGLGMDSETLADRETLGVILGDFVMKRIEQTKGAVSNKEMALFQRWSAGEKKDTATNLKVFEAALAVEKRAALVSRKARELYRTEGLGSIEADLQLQDFMDSRTVFPDLGSMEIPEARGQAEIDAAMKERLREMKEALKKKGSPNSPSPSSVAPGPDDKKVDLRYSRPGHPQFPRAPRTRKTGIPEWYANPEGRSAFEQVRDTPGAPGTFEGYSNLSSAEKLALRDEALEGAPRAVRVPEAPVPGAFKVMDTHRATSATRTALKGVKYVISTDFNSGGRGEPTPSPGIEVVVPKHAPAGAVSKVKQYLKETEAWLRSKGVKTSIRTTGKNQDGVIYEGKSSRFYYTEPFFKTDADSRKAIEKDPRGYARILARTLGTLPGVTFIPPHTAKDKGAELPGSNISEQAWALKHVIPFLQELSTR